MHSTEYEMKEGFQQILSKRHNCPTINSDGGEGGGGELVNIFNNQTVQLEILMPVSNQLEKVYRRKKSFKRKKTVKWIS